MIRDSIYQGELWFVLEMKGHDRLSKKERLEEYAGIGTDHDPYYKPLPEPEVKEQN